MALRTTMTFPADDDDDLDVEALRRAALQTLKKPSAPLNQTQGFVSSGHNVSSGPARIMPQGGPHVSQNRGRGRVMMKRGRGRGFGNFHNGSNPNFFTNRPSGNSNLITIVPTLPDESGVPKNTPRGSHRSGIPSRTSAPDSTLNEEEKVPAKFRRVDDDSDSEETDDEHDFKTGSGAESSNDEEERKGGSDSDPEKDGDLVSLQPDKDEGDDSLERLMRELEEEISEAPKDLKLVASASSKDKTKVPKVKREKKDQLNKEEPQQESSKADSISNSVSSSDNNGHNGAHQRTKAVPLKNPAGSLSVNSAQNINSQSRSPPRQPPSGRCNSPKGPWSPGRCDSPLQPAFLHDSFHPVAHQRAYSPQPARQSPHRLRSPPRSRSPPVRSPVRLRSPARSRSPRRSRSPLRSRSPRRSPPRIPTRSSRSPNFVHRPGSRSPYRSPRRSPSHHPPPRVISPGRLPPLRSRSRSPRLLARSPDHLSYVRRSRSRTPLLRRSPSSPRRSPVFRRSRSRSPGGRPYDSRRSRSISPRIPIGPRRSPSPRSRRSPSPYLKKLSPKRRSISPRRRSISPRRRSLSPRRRSISPRRRSISPRRRPSSPSWGRPSPRRSRSPIGVYSERPVLSRRRSPAKRSPSPISRRYSPLPHRGGSPLRPYRSPSPISRSNVRRRSPVQMNEPPRRSPPRHRAGSPSYRLSPSKQSRFPASPGRNREKQRHVSPLPSVSRTNQRSLSPRRQRSPPQYQRIHQSTKAVSPVRKISPPLRSLKRSASPLKDTATAWSGKDRSPSDSISLSPSPERVPASKVLDERSKSRKSYPLNESQIDSKRSRVDLRNVLPRRKEVAIESEVAASTRSDESSRRDRKERKRAKRVKHKRDSHKDANVVLEARRRKFESSRPVESSDKKIRLANVTSEHPICEEPEDDERNVEVNLEKEKERELKEVNEVDESILDRELMGGVDLLWSDEEEEEEDNTDAPSPSNHVQFKRTFNLPSFSGSSGKENIPDDDSKRDDEEPTSTTGSPPGNQNLNDESEHEDFEAASDSSGEIKDEEPDKESQDTRPKTNWELKQYILSQAKNPGAVVRFPKSAAKELPKKSEANDSDGDLRAELSRRRAEKLAKVNICPEALPGRLLQSALQGVGVKSRHGKEHRRRVRSPYMEDEIDKQDNEGRRVLVLRRAVEQKEPAINITISKVDSMKESSSSKATGKLPIHMRLGTGKKGDVRPKKVKLKRNITVGRKKQV